MARVVWFVIGFVAVSIAFVGMFDIVRTLARGDEAYDPSAFLVGHFWVLLIQWSLIPALGALVGMLFLDAARPMTVFASSSERTYSLMVRGAITGAIWLALLMILLPAINDHVPDTLVIASSAPIVTVLVLTLSTRRVRPGRCDGCGHDLRGTRHLGRCTECGMSCKPDYAPIAGEASKGVARSNIRAARSSVSS